MWAETAERLADLVTEFGPSTTTVRTQSAADPFTTLRSDAVGELSSDVPMDRVLLLAENRVTG